MRERDRLRRGERQKLPSVWELHPTLLDDAIALGLDGNSFEAISRILSKRNGIELTRNAVISKFDRAGVAKPKVSGDTPKKSAVTGWRADREKPEAENERKYPPDVEIMSLLAKTGDTVHPPVPIWKRVGIQDISDTQCRWPIGDPQTPDFHFCAMQRAAGLSYCAGHAEVAYAMTTRQRQKSVAAVVVVEIETVD